MLQLLIGTSVNLAIAIAILLCFFSMSFYGCWVHRRFDYAVGILTDSAAPPPPKPTFLIFLSVLIGTLYSCFLVIGTGAARASRSNLKVLYISLILLSLAWTMLVIRNTLLASISRVKYMEVAYGVELKPGIALCDTLKHLMGSICMGSLLVPILGFMWGSARAKQLFNEPGESCCSCANCYADCASTLMMYGNRWGFVHVGLYNKSFVQSSTYAWDLFRKIGLEELINSDLTGSFCFLSGMAVGAICSLVSGIWALVVHKSYATELSLYAFFIGYIMVRRSVIISTLQTFFDSDNRDLLTSARCS